MTSLRAAGAADADSLLSMMLELYAHDRINFDKLFVKEGFRGRVDARALYRKSGFVDHERQLPTRRL